MTDFIHRYEPATNAGSPPLLLLHGTGGDENDLLGLGKMISPGSALLSPRGRVLEHGMPRFFRRLAEGVFDEDDVRRRALELGEFVADARKQYGIAAPVAVGFSNGANIAAALLLLKPDVLAGAILLRAMVPLSDPPKSLKLTCRQAGAAAVRAGRPDRAGEQFGASLPRCCRKQARASATRSCRRAINCRKQTSRSPATGSATSRHWSSRATASCRRSWPRPRCRLNRSRPRTTDRDREAGYGLRSTLPGFPYWSDRSRK